MAAKRKVDNLMALAVLATVVQRPMHRYEIASLMRARGKDQDMDVKWGSLYTVVQNLAKHGFLEVVGTSRQGARPERTVYQITEAGRQEMLDWTRELLSTPEPEHPKFAAGLSVQMILSPDEVIALLRARLGRLEESIAARRAAVSEHLKEVPRLFLVEDEFAVAMVEAEAAWVRGLLEELASGSFPDLASWRAFHDGGEMPPGPGAAARSHPRQTLSSRCPHETNPATRWQPKDSWVPVRDLGTETTDEHHMQERTRCPQPQRPKSAPHWSSAAESPVPSSRPPCARPASRRRSTRPTPPWPKESAAAWPWPPTAWPHSPSSAPTMPSGPSPHRSRARSWRSAGTPADCPAWRTRSRSRSSAAATCTGCSTTGRPSRASASSTVSAWPEPPKARIR